MAEVRPLESVVAVKIAAVDPPGKVTVAVEAGNGALKQEDRPPAIAMFNAILRKILPP